MSELHKVLMIVENVLSLSNVEAVESVVTGIIGFGIVKVFDFTMHYKNILYFIRLEIAKKINADLVKSAIRQVEETDVIEDPADFMNQLYHHIAKRNMAFKLLLCPICMSFWVLLGLAIIYDFSLMQFIISYISAYYVASLY